MNIKKLTLSLAAAAILSTSAVAESSYIGYQGVAFDDGSAIASTDVSLRVTIYNSSDTVVYQETKSSVTTTDKGYFSHNIGSGTRTAGANTWADVTWADDYKIKIELDKDNGTSYTDLGTKDLVSVPFAKGIDGVTASAAEINVLDGFTGNTSDLTYAQEIRTKGITPAEFGYLDNLTSNIQTQLNTKLSSAGGTITDDINLTQNKKIANGSDTDDYISFTDANRMKFFMEDKNFITLFDQSNDERVIFNDGGDNIDFQIKGDDDSTLFWVDAANAKVGIGMNNPAIDLAIGDNDTGINQNGDGVLELYANNNAIATITSSGIATTSLALSSSGATPLSVKREDDSANVGMKFEDNARTIYAGMAQGGTNPRFAIGKDADNGDLGDAKFMVDSVTGDIISYGGAVFNGDGATDRDFRVESNTSTHMLFVDASADKVDIRKGGIGTYFTISGDDANGARGIDFTSSSGQHTGDTHTINKKGISGILAFSVDNDEKMRFKTTDILFKESVTFNENGGDKDFLIIDDGNATMLFADASTSRIGIGTSSPSYPLHVATENDTGDMNAAFYGKDGSTNATRTGPLTTDQNPGEDVSIFAVGGIISEVFFANSDKRIKKDIKDINNSIAKLMQVRPTVYKKKDTIKSGDGYHYGFIAQELEKVVPEAVTKSVGEVPILKPYDEVSFEEDVQYTILVKNGSDIKEQIFTKGDARPHGEIIVKSKKVDDFRTVDYDSVFTIAVDAIQEQQDIINTQEKKIKTLESKLQAIETALKNSGISID